MTRVIDVQGLGRRVHEVLILAVLARGARHGYQIALDVEAWTGGRFELQHGTLYPILHRLEREGLIRGRWEAGSGRRRKAYEVTPAGRAYLDETGAVVVGALGALERLLQEAF